MSLREEPRDLPELRKNLEGDLHMQRDIDIHKQLLSCTSLLIINASDRKGSQLIF